MNTTQHTTEDPTSLLFAAIADVAPELTDELPGLDRDVDLWDALELDSMDHLNVMERLANATGCDIPELDYPQLTSVDQIVDYVAARR